MKDKGIKKVLVIGSGPIIIGQAAEFDYSGTQVCLALKEEGVKTILFNSNPATIQTDTTVADKIYFEPMQADVLEKIIMREKPDGIIATAGGQTALNLAKKLSCNVRFLGTGLDAITKGEDRGLFCAIMQKIGQPVLASKIVDSVKDGVAFAKQIGYPIVIRSLYTLGGTGSGIAYSGEELQIKLIEGLNLSLEKKALVEKSVVGWGELEYEVIRDSAGNKLMICAMENIDPMGVHTGESIVVAPQQTISDADHQKMRHAALQIVEALNIQGGCNVQFAFDYKTGEYFVIEINPRLSRSSALASKATGYPIARIAAKIALGYLLPEIINPITGKTAYFEPALDYVVVKIPKWPDEKFPDMDKNIGMTMKSTGETMAIGRTFGEAMYKAIAGLELKKDILHPAALADKKIIIKKISVPNTERLGWIFKAFASGVTAGEVADISGIHSWFIHKLHNLFQQKHLVVDKINVYKMVDSCAGEFSAITPYFYSTHGMENEATFLSGPKAIILGSGPIRIGQGIEFDYLTVHAAQALKKFGIKSIIINNNPETVSTDFSVSDRLYFEPLTWEFVKKVIDNEKDGLLGVFVQFGGQTAINLANKIHDYGIQILGTSAFHIELAENRQKTAELAEHLGLKMPTWKTANNKAELVDCIAQVGFPLLIRPSFVIAGEGMILAHNLAELSTYLPELSEKFSKPFLVDSFLAEAKEIDIDLISNGSKTVCFILEQIEPAGVHSGDSHSVFPAQSLTKAQINQLQAIANLVAKKFKIKGFGNIQCAIKGNDIFVLEINPRASRTVPFLCKALQKSLVPMAVKAIIKGNFVSKKIKSLKKVYIKKPVFSLEKMTGVSKTLGPVMKSTGEAMLVCDNLQQALIVLDK